MWKGNRLAWRAPACVLMLGLLLAGCGEASAPPPADPGGEAATKPAPRGSTLPPRQIATH